MLRKINAGLSLITTASVLTHMGLVLSGTHARITFIMPNVTLALVVAHAVLSILIMLFFNEGKNIKYVKLNASTVVQRVSAVLLFIPLFTSHQNAYFNEEMHTLSYGISEIAFFIFVFAHIGTSLPKALITLGILKSEGAVKILSVLSILIAAALAMLGISFAVRMIIL